MVKLTILYRTPVNETAFDDRYIKNLALMEKMPGIVRMQANMVLGSPSGKSPYSRVLELYFDSMEALDRALTSQEGRAAGLDLIQFAGHGVEMIFADVYEDFLTSAQRD
jgi:uncharacterized protein (TIGR02118 family)